MQQMERRLEKRYAKRRGKLNTDVKGTVSRDLIGPYIVLMDRP